jgi:TRAP-type C4-dicarboxylate transport system permease large subunit
MTSFPQSCTGASAFGWMLAYLRGPDTVAEYIQAFAGTDPRTIMLLLVLLFIIVGDFVDAVPVIIIFMPSFSSWRRSATSTRCTWALSSSLRWCSA